jgi:hypothetical protein
VRLGVYSRFTRSIETNVERRLLSSRIDEKGFRPI